MSAVFGRPGPTGSLPAPLGLLPLQLLRALAGAAPGLFRCRYRLAVATLIGLAQVLCLRDQLVVLAGEGQLLHLVVDAQAVFDQLGVLLLQRLDRKSVV